MANRKIRRVTTRYKWDRVKVSFWFAPVAMSAAAIVLSWLMLWLDNYIPNEMLDNSRLILSGNVDQARTGLISMAATILTTAGIVFTLLTLPLSTVVAQFGSRLLRVFLGDRTTQYVLGMFVATFVYCIASATSIPPAETQPDAAQITTTFGLILMLGTLASLVVMVQHISTMLQAPNIAAAAGAELMEVVHFEILENLASGDFRRGESDILSDSFQEKEAYSIYVDQPGAIQYIDPQYLLTLAIEHNLTVRLLRKPGHIVWRGTRVALVWPASRVDEKLDRQLRNAFRIGNGRTPTQDIVYAVNQLVEMAVRAMSPAINDPFTAINCLDYIGEGLALFIKRGEKSPYYYDEGNNLRLILEPVTLSELLNNAFNMLRHASCDNATVLLHMLDVMASLCNVAESISARHELLLHVSLIQQESLAGKLIDWDRERISKYCVELTDLLQEKIHEVRS